MGDGYLGRYRLDELLGSGGSAEVWRAHDTAADRTVALKMLAHTLTADPEYRQRFEREARAASLLHGPHVVAVHTYGELEGRLYIESEFVDGLDIEALLEWEGPMCPDAAVDLIAQIASALDEAHAAGLVHRDVKPQNIIVAPDDVAYLIDFGTALQDGQTAITQTGMLVGTPAYMAPERFEGAASPRSDIYSLACVLYECLTGQRPFRVRNPAQLMRAHLERTPEPASALAPAVPTALDQVIARGLAKQPAERYSTAGEFADAARAALTVPAPTAPPAVRGLGDQTTVALAAPVPAVDPMAAVQARSTESGMDARTVALSMNSNLGAVHTGSTRRWAFTAAGLMTAAIAIAIGAAWVTGRAAEPQPDQRTRMSAVATTKAPVRVTVPSAIDSSIEAPAAEPTAPPSDGTLIPAAPPRTADPRPPGPGGPGPGGDNRPGGDNHRGGPGDRRPHGHNSFQ
ncbi:serine/threonine-protein kinase [Nocardia aurantiaca]|uniref:serine/threonine-protein kinase n=1 Tax=Nocardia aurantiaca TaxID=2675850 RepID=UPI0018A95E19|nr:serine/threonine-protein kinase [Nocardia aurantiaca]